MPMIGRTVAQYQILEKLGAGGMGEIYKAQDTRLNRLVAIKVLPTDRSADPERRKRFLLEAQAASALNHPSIITIHDVISEKDAEFMVMELVAGKTLTDLIPKGGLRVPQALSYALQMADALTVAHTAGIVHRDLKPANVMISDSGFVKILDFGLAKLMDPGSSSGTKELADTDATSMALTIEGAILGTVNYMSPEQAQGKKVDARSDIFSFAAVFYEMLTGRHAFEGESSVSTLSAILRDDVKPMMEVAPDVPAPVEMVIQRCMRKDPDERFQTMREVRDALTALKRESDSRALYSTILAAPGQPATTAGRSPKQSRTLLIGIAAVLLALIVGGGVWLRTARKHVEPAPAAPSPVETAAKPAEEQLTNDGIVALIQEKVPVEVILDHIRSTKATSFDLSTSELIRLTKAGVPPSVIDQMRNPGSVLPVQTASAGNTANAKTTTADPANSGVGKKDPAPSTPKTTTVVLDDATPIRITLADAIPTDANVGLQLRFTVSEDFQSQGVVVLSKGALVYGEITETAKKKLFGIGGGKLSFSLSKAQTPAGAWVNVRAIASRRTDGANQRPVETPSKKDSKNIAAAEGTEYIAYIDGSQSLELPSK